MRRLVFIALACACGGRIATPPPAPLRIAPQGAYRGVAAHVRVWGDAFNASAVHRLGGGNRVDDLFHVRLGGVELANVRWVGADGSQQLLEADAPADLPVGQLDLEVQDPLGQVGKLAKAWTESDRAPPQVALAAAGPAQVEASAPFTAELTLSNHGGEAALLTALSLDGAAVEPGAALLAAGEVRALRVQRSVAAGPVALHAALDARDLVTGEPLAQATATIATTALLPPQLSISANALPATVNLGQPLNLDLVVSNQGQIDALAVLPTLLPSAVGSMTTISPQDVRAGAQVHFAATFIAGASGPLSLSVSAAGADALTAAQVQTGAQPMGSVLVQRPAALRIAPAAIPAQVSRGQSFGATVSVTNTGDATALGVTVAVSTSPSGGAQLSVGSAPRFDLAGGQSRLVAIAMSENGTGPGAVDLLWSAAATDANDGSTARVSFDSGVIVVQRPAALSGAWTVPASAGQGATFTAVLTVTNTGDAGATAVTPVATVSGTGAATFASGPASASATIAGGGSASFTWTLTATATGNVQLSANSTAIDANDGAALSTTSTSSLIAIGEATTLATAPFGNDGTTFSYLFSYQGQVYLGPNKGGSGAVRMAPDGTNVAQVNWQLEVQYASGGTSGARNSAYNNNGPTGVLCHTIGVPSCTQNTAQCGPDDESGHGIFMSGFTGSTEWYALTGASTIGGVRYLYMTNPGFPLASGGYDDLAYVQVQAGQQGSTRMASAGHFFNGKLYVGFLDSGGGSTGGTAPVLNVLNHMPSLPGSVAALGTDLVNLNAMSMPAIGASGSPANSGSTWLMIDAITDFGGMLYLGNNGGLVRSTTATPGACSGSCSDWANATPSSAGWGAKTSVVVDGTVLGSLKPSQRAVPGLAAFGGRLFAARNTTTGPQLWACTPGVSGDPQQCDPGDWALIARNASGDAQLSQMGDTNNGAISLLAATAGHLYVGYDDANGVQIWRTASATASSIADFTGQAGCVAGTAGCQGVGGNGLGNASTRIFDGKVLDFSSQEWVYVSSGTGSASPVVSRIVP